jgi:hypothetical protein
MLSHIPSVGITGSNIQLISPHYLERISCVLRPQKIKPAEKAQVHSAASGEKRKHSVPTRRLSRFFCRRPVNGRLGVLSAIYAGTVMTDRHGCFSPIPVSVEAL